MKAKYSFLIASIISSNMILAQTKVCYNYDKAGNRTDRSKQSVFCQQTNKIDASEFIQILDMYFSKINKEDFFYASVYAVKLFRAEHDSYTVVLASICYVDELPSDSIIFIELQDIKLFILTPGEIDVSEGVNNNYHFVRDKKEIKKLANSNLVREGIKYYPFIVIFTANKKKVLL